jgi:hypothetical protein
LQILADAGSIRLHRDPIMVREMRARPDAVTHQHDRALRRTRGKNDLPRQNDDRSATAGESG